MTRAEYLSRRAQLFSEWSQKPTGGDVVAFFRDLRVAQEKLRAEYMDSRAAAGKEAT